MKLTILHPQFVSLGGAERFSILTARTLGADIITAAAPENIHSLFPDVVFHVCKYMSALSNRWLFNAFDLAIATGKDADFFIASSEAALPAALLSRRPFLYYAHAFPFDREGGAFFSMNKALHRLVPSENMVCNSRFTCERYNQAYGFRGSHVVYPPIDYRKYRQGEMEDYFLYVGRLEPDKGVLSLLNAAVNTGVRLKIVGSGSLLTEISQMAEKHGNIEFLGSVSDDALVEIYSHAKAFVFPSVNEPFGLVPLEALASGVPVIARFGSGGHMEYLNDDVAWFFNSESDLQALLKLPDKNYMEKRGAGLEISMNFDASKYEKAMRTVIEKLMTKP